MAKKKKKSKVKRMVGSTPMDVVKSPGPAEYEGGKVGTDSMDTSEFVVTELGGSSRTLSAFSGVSNRVIKKGTEKRRAAKLRKNKALEKAVAMVDKQEQRLMKQELKSFRVQTMNKLDATDQ